MKSESHSSKPIPWAELQNDVTIISPVPTCFKKLAGKTIPQLIQTYFPKGNLEAIAGLAVGIVDFGIPLPQWVKNSSWQFWKYYVGNKPLDFDKSAEDFGVGMKLVEIGVEGNMHIIKPEKKPSKIDRWMCGIAAKFLQILNNKIIPKLSDEEKSQYYAGRVRGEKIIALLRDPEYLKMAKRAQIYIVIACAWRQIEALETHAERERWLRTNKVIPDNVNLREVYEIFSVIGLPAAPVGRPKNVKSVPCQIAGS